MYTIFSFHKPRYIIFDRVGNPKIMIICKKNPTRNSFMFTHYRLYVCAEYVNSDPLILNHSHPLTLKSFMSPIYGQV